MKIVSEFVVPSKISEEEAWQRVHTRILQEIPQKRTFWKRPNWIGMAAAIAAVLGLIIVFQLFISPKNLSTITTEAAVEKEITLPDGSFARLAGGSELQYDKESWRDSREIKLKGKAFFDVVPGTDFLVFTPEGMVKVVGTSFDVIQRNHSFEVHCKTGKVIVQTRKNQETLESGEGARKNPQGELNTFNVDAEVVGGWHQGLFQFNESRLVDVLDEISKTYGVNISTENIPEDIIYSGQFEAKDVHTALDFICIPLGLSKEVVDEKNLILKKNENVDERKYVK